MKKKSSLGLVFRVCFLAVFVLFLYIARECIYLSSNNYYGYCAEGFNEGVKLSVDQRLDLAINHYLKNQLSYAFGEIRNAEDKALSRADLRSRFSLVPYKSVREFKELNPTCCDRVYGLVEGDFIGFEERISGAGDGVFKFSHKVRYENSEGGLKEIVSESSYYLVSNCGVPKYSFYY